jgi:hypothetical protein
VNDAAPAVDPILSRSVAAAQRWIESIYRLELGLRAERYLLSPSEALELVPDGAPQTGLLIVEEADGLSVGLYLDPSDAGDPDAIVEETSHLLYLAWHAHRDLKTSQLMLELQSEVDRYAVARLRGGEALRHFERFEWVPGLDPDQRARYARAHHAAERYCRGLERRFPKRCDTPGLLAELRRYYRAAPNQKLAAA